MDRRHDTPNPVILACAVALVCVAVLAGAVASHAAEGSGDGGAAGEGAWRAPRPPQDVPTGHWSYPLLTRLVARRVVYVDLSTLPVSRVVVGEALLDARDSEDERPELTAREAWALERLEAEFLGGEVDAPAAHLEENDAMFGLGVRLFSQLRYGGDRATLGLWGGDVPGGPTTPRDDEEDDEYRLDVAIDVAPEIWGGVRNLVGFYTDADVLFGGQEGARTVRISERTRTWRGVAATVERAYFMLEQPRFAVAAGRRDPVWGRARWGRLLISGAAPTFDQVDARFRVGPLSFHALHGHVAYEETGTENDLAEYEKIYIAAHRLVVAGSWGSFAASEAVVYSSTTPDPVYLNPLFPFYLAQHNERENDNIEWSFDLLLRPTRGLDVYAEFLVDDLQYDRYTEHPDKYGVTIGGTYFGRLLGSDLELTTEYSNVRKWTYSSNVVEHRFAHDGLPIGFELGPDSDRIAVEAVTHPNPEWSVGLGYRHARKGEGRLTDPFVPGENPDPTFPSGVVMESDRVSLEANYQNFRGVAGGIGVAWRNVRNRGNVSGEDGDDWEIWAGIQVRI
jgi:hypothetical protein